MTKNNMRTNYKNRGGFFGYLFLNSLPLFFRKKKLFTPLIVINGKIWLATSIAVDSLPMVSSIVSDVCPIVYLSVCLSVSCLENISR